MLCSQFQKQQFVLKNQLGPPECILRIGTVQPYVLYYFAQLVQQVT